MIWFGIESMARHSMQYLNKVNHSFIIIRRCSVLNLLAIQLHKKYQNNPLSRTFQCYCKELGCHQMENCSKLAVDFPPEMWCHRQLEKDKSWSQYILVVCQVPSLSSPGLWYCPLQLWLQDRLWIILLVSSELGRQVSNVFIVEIFILLNKIF